MARCNDATCNCVVRGGQGVAVAGAGTPQSPYVVTVDQSGRLTVVDTPTVDLSLTGQGTADDPGLLSATLIAHLGDLVDVAKGVPVNGQVLAWTGSQWAPVPPATAAPGAVAVGAGLTGDGSSGAPLRPVVDPSGGLAVGTLGIAMSAATLTRLTNLESQKLTPQYLRVERTDLLNLVDATWTRPTSFNTGVTKVTGTRLSYSGGFITTLDAGVYAWETTHVWASLAAQASEFNRSVCIQINDVSKIYGQRGMWYAGNANGGLRDSAGGTVVCAAGDKVRPAFYVNTPSNSATAVTPEQFALYRVA